jgi:hypothetical protein
MSTPPLTVPTLRALISPLLPPRWIALGTALGRHRGAYQRQVHMRRPDNVPEVPDVPEIISGDPVLLRFVFDIRRRFFDLRQAN